MQMRESGGRLGAVRGLETRKHRLSGSGRPRLGGGDVHSAAQRYREPEV